MDRRLTKVQQLLNCAHHGLDSLESIFIVATRVWSLLLFDIVFSQKNRFAQSLQTFISEIIEGQLSIFRHVTSAGDARSFAIRKGE
jgi:hypothetical protein